MRLTDVQVTRAVVATVWHVLYQAPIPICTSDDSPAWRRKAVVEDLTLNEPSSWHVTPNVGIERLPEAVRSNDGLDAQCGREEPVVTGRERDWWD